MKKINLLTTLSATFASVLMSATICSCSKPKEPVEPDHIKWDFKNNDFYVPQQIKEGAGGAKQYEAIDSYLSDAKQNPRPFLEDILYSENVEYFTLKYITPGELLKYEAEYKASIEEDSNEGLVASLEISRDIIFQPITGDAWESKTSLTLTNITYYSKFSIEQQSGKAVRNWSFIPSYIGLSLEDFKTTWSKLTSGWTIQGSIENPLAGEEENIEYDFNALKVKDMNEIQFNYLNQAYYGVSYSYYYSEVPLITDDNFAYNGPSDKPYTAVERKPAEYIGCNFADETFESGIYGIEVLDTNTPIANFPFSYELDGHYHYVRTNDRGQISIGSVAKNSNLLLHIVDWTSHPDKDLTFNICKLIQ